MSDEQIRQLAEKSGMWGVDDWWKQEIPRLRKFLELASTQQDEQAGAPPEKPLRGMVWRSDKELPTGV